MERHTEQNSILLTEKRCVEIHDRLTSDDSPRDAFDERSNYSLPLTRDRDRLAWRSVSDPLQAIALQAIVRQGIVR